MTEEELEFISQEGAEVLASFKGHMPSAFDSTGTIFIGIKDEKVLLWEDWSKGQVIFFCEKNFFPKFVEFIGILESEETMDLERLGDGELEDGPDAVSIWLTDPYRGDDFQLTLFTRRRYRNPQEEYPKGGPWFGMPSKEFPQTMLPALRKAEDELRKRGYLPQDRE